MSELNEATEASVEQSIEELGGIPVIDMEVSVSGMTAYPTDQTLTIQGMPADAKATGDAIEKLQDAVMDDHEDIGTIAEAVEAIEAWTGEDLPVSTTDSTKLNTAIAVLEARNATNIPMSSEEGAQSIATAISGISTKDASEIHMSSTDQTTVKAAIESVAGDVEDIQSWTADDIKYVSTGEDSIKDKIDDINSSIVKSVNNVQPDPVTHNIQINSVPVADDLSSEDNVQVEGQFITRTTAGQASISPGNAWIQKLKGNSVHTGYSPAVWEYSWISERADPEDELNVEITKATFVLQVGNPGTYTFLYTTAWKLDNATVSLTDYGINVTGTPVAGDTITVKYAEEIRGTITNAAPTSFASTGWNLFNSEYGYARVVAYEGKYKVGGTYSTIRFKKTLESPQSDPVVVDNNGLFTVEEDGYIILTGFNAANTYVLICWTKWENGYDGEFKQYEESMIDLSAVKDSMPYDCLCSVGTVYDEINFNTKRIIPRVKRIAYSDGDRETIAASGKQYDFDEQFIYVEMTAEETAAATSSFELGNQYAAADNGIEYFEGTDAPVGFDSSYGASLKDKLRRDVLVMSQQTLSDEQKAQVQNNIGVKESLDTIRNVLNKAFLFTTHSYQYTCAASGNANITAAQLGITAKAGYKLAAIVKAYSGEKHLVFYQINPVTDGNVLSIRNVATSERANKTAGVIAMWIRNDLV